jgi:hypothetical protein
MAFVGANLVREGDRGLFIYVAGGDGAWMALAFEGPRVGNPFTVLTDHAHHLIGEFATMTAAQRAAESYGRRWMRGAAIVGCGCDEID